MTTCSADGQLGASCFVMSFINTTFSKKLITEVTLPSGSCESSLIQIQVLLSAPSKTASRSSSRGCFLYILPVRILRAEDDLPSETLPAAVNAVCTFRVVTDMTASIQKERPLIQIILIQSAHIYHHIFRQPKPAFSGVKIACNRFFGAGWYSLTS